MSPRAAWRLDTLGFKDACDYAGGKSDWKSAGLPVDGEHEPDPVALDVVRDVPRCGLRDRIGDVDRGDGTCVVTTPEGVVLGRLRGEAWDADPSAEVEAVMEGGSTTVRADEDLAALAGRMRKADVDQIIVSAADGELLGLLTLSDAEEHLGRG